jgi:hypothetical protein
LVLPELNGLFYLQFVGVHLGIEAIIGFQDDREPSGASIY